MAIETVNMRKEILSVGIWNGIKITTEMLSEMVANFNELKERKPIPLRVGHTSDDKPNTKVLAAGWVDSLEKIGNKLVANIRNTPVRIAEFIQKEFLKSVSVEFRKLWKDGETGKEFKNVLSAIAVMGVATPAVAGLEDFEISFKDEDKKNIEKIEYQEENDMTKELELQQEIAKLETEKAVLLAEQTKATEFQDEIKKKDVDLTKANADLKKANADLKAVNEKAEEFAKKQETAKIEEFIEKNSSEKSMKILPAEKERVGRILKALDNETISFEEKDVKINVREEFQALLEGRKDLVDFKKKTDKGDTDKADENIEFESKEERDEYILEKANEMMKKDKEISFADASIQVIETLDKEEV